MNEWAMKVSMLASGSSGNSTYIETPNAKLLVDAGLSGKKLEMLMNQIDRQLQSIDAIFITHEHKDHIHGVGVLARKYNCALFANEKTWAAMEGLIGHVPNEQKFIIPMGQTITFNDVDVSSYGVSHDAAAPQFYSFQRLDKRFVMLTDTGYVSDRLRDELKNADLYLMESNHDVNLLRGGSYPWSTKQRILGDKGHLSNDDGALAMSDMIGDNTKRIYLGHLSKENNMKDIARDTFTSILRQKDHAVNSDFFIYDTDPDKPTDLITL